MNDKLFIPKLCKAGFNLRKDTYTGTLAYIIYNDGKTWRKETSWESWREKYSTPELIETEKRKQYDANIAYYTDPIGYYKYTQEQALKLAGDYSKFKPSLQNIVSDKRVNPVEFDNVPTSGFVLNKKVGGYKSDWNYRNPYCRVYDPRGFEFEISMENLLFILQECDSFKGKGLDGEFVYAWAGKDLVLLPTTTLNYQESVQHTKLQSEKFSVKQMKESLIYVDKAGNNLVYIGRYPFYKSVYTKGVKRWSEKIRVEKKCFVFINIKTDAIISMVSISTIAKPLSSTPVADYVKYVDIFSNSHLSRRALSFISTEQGIDDFDNKYQLFKQKNGSHDWVSYNTLYIIEENMFYCVTIWFEKKSYLEYDRASHSFKNNTLGVKVCIRRDRCISIDGDGGIIQKDINEVDGNLPRYSVDDIQKMKFYTLQVNLERIGAVDIKTIM